MTARYLADAEALSHYLFDALPPAASDVFDRGEAGIDTIETPDVQLMETLFSAARRRELQDMTPDSESPPTPGSARAIKGVAGYSLRTALLAFNLAMMGLVPA